MALCFNCGHVKFGAICPCPKCKVTSTGDMALDIAFSDHNFAVETLEEFGSVITAIRAACDDPEIRFWTFIHYVSENHSSILKVKLKPEVLQIVSEAMKNIAFPPVTLRESAVHKNRPAPPAQGT